MILALSTGLSTPTPTAPDHTMSPPNFAQGGTHFQEVLLYYDAVSSPTPLPG